MTVTKGAAKAVKSGGSVDNTGDNYPLSKEKSPGGVEFTLKNLKKRTKSTVRNLNRVNLYHFIGETVVESGGIEGGQKKIREIGGIKNQHRHSVITL